MLNVLLFASWLLLRDKSSDVNLLFSLRNYSGYCLSVEMCHLTTPMARYHGTAGVARPAMSRNNASIRLCDRTLLLPATQESTALLMCTAVVVAVEEKCDKPWRRRVLFFHFENKPEALFGFCAWHPILHDSVVDGKVKKKKSKQVSNIYWWRAALGTSA